MRKLILALTLALPAMAEPWVQYRDSAGCITLAKLVPWVAATCKPVLIVGVATTSRAVVFRIPIKLGNGLETTIELSGIATGGWAMAMWDGIGDGAIVGRVEVEELVKQ